MACGPVVRGCFLVFVVVPMALLALWLLVGFIAYPSFIRENGWLVAAIAGGILVCVAAFFVILAVAGVSAEWLFGWMVGPAPRAPRKRRSSLE